MRFNGFGGPCAASRGAPASPAPSAACGDGGAGPVAAAAPAVGSEALSGLRLRPPVRHRLPQARRCGPSRPSPGTASMIADPATLPHAPCARPHALCPLRYAPAPARRRLLPVLAPSARPVRHSVFQFFNLSILQSSIPCQTRPARLPFPLPPSTVTVDRPGENRQIPRPANGVPAATECPAARRRVQQGLPGGVAPDNLLSFN